MGSRGALGFGTRSRSFKRKVGTLSVVIAYSDYLFCVQASYENQQDIQLMRFADYFGRAFVTVSAAQFPWAKMFKESTVSKMIDVSYCFPRYYSGIYYACDHSFSRLCLDAIAVCRRFMF